MIMDYQDALKNSPFWVKQAYKEFVKLPIETQKKTPFLYLKKIVLTHIFFVQVAEDQGNY